MQRKYIEDFSELERMLVLDMNFLRCACNGYEDRDLLICIIRIMYSIYLTFQYREDWTLQDVGNYVDTMVQYLRVGQSHSIIILTRSRSLLSTMIKNRCITRQSGRF